MTDHHSDDKDYNLNHFDFSPEEPRKPHHDDDANDNEHIDEGRQEPLVIGKPLVDDDPFSGNHAEAIKIPADDGPLEIATPAIPQMESDFAADQPHKRSSGSSMATAFAVVAMLIAAGAVWLNFNQTEESNPAASEDQLASGYNTIINDELIKLRERLAIVELEKSELSHKVGQQNQVLLQMQQDNRTFANQIESLKAEMARISGQLSNQAKVQTPVKPVAKPVVRKTASTAVPVKNAARKNTSQYELPAPLESLPTSENTGSSGEWVVNIASVYSQSSASRELARLQNMGINAEISESLVNGKQLFRIRIGGFANRAEATQQKELLASKHGIKDAWIHKP